jgi:DNA processing protein
VAGVPDDAYIVAMARLPKVGPARLRALLSTGAPAEVWRRLRAGTIDVSCVVHPGRSDPCAIVDGWRVAAHIVDPQAYWQAHADADVGVAVRGSASFPPELAADDDPPSVVFWKGDPDHLAGSRVAIVGTRRATRYGIDVANELGRELSLAGVSVVSGLAIGIDGAAHAGAIAVDGAPPIAIVGSGLDRIYPREHRTLWRRVAERGVVLSEYPLGAPAAAWQFPARNRIIAALADVVVVVESQSTGGALGTAVEAARRSRPVLAVPGPVTAPSSAGTNQLLFDGCAPARDVSDVLLALGREPQPRRVAAERRPAPRGHAATLLAAIPWQSVPVERLVTDTGLSLGDLMIALDGLDADGWIIQRGGWVERVARAGARR